MFEWLDLVLSSNREQVQTQIVMMRGELKA